jgi:ribosomal 50S subunit-recycling heat shock protein
MLVFSKIEKMFYADRIRVNGERPKKKSQVMREGDEIDILQKSNEKNPDFIDISRIEIARLGEEIEEDDEDMIDVKGSDDEDYRIPAVLKRYKRLTVENYKQKWKGPVE